MSETCPPGPSGSSAVSPPSRPLKRPLSTDELFPSSEATFQPKPWPQHKASHAAYLPKEEDEEPPLPSVPQTLAIVPPSRASAGPTMSVDPQPTDPGVIFVRAPFTTFPNSERFNGNLCYRAFADNPDMFLLVADFKHQGNPDPLAVTYPPEFEPPRGCCVKKKGPAGSVSNWADGEEPKLRCTFCRRQYAGVNAKSMWRRHVFEKHKVAMSNRREVNEGQGGTGRNANKENKKAGRIVLTTHEPIPSIPLPEASGSRSDVTFFDETELTHARNTQLQSNSDPSEESVIDSVGESSAMAVDTFSPSSPVLPPVCPSTPSKGFRMVGRASSDSPLVNFSPYDPSRTPQFRESAIKTAPRPWFLSVGSPSTNDNDPRAQPLTNLYTSARRARPPRRVSSSPYSSGGESEEFIGPSSSPEHGGAPDMSIVENPVYAAVEDETEYLPSLRSSQASSASSAYHPEDRSSTPFEDPIIPSGPPKIRWNEYTFLPSPERPALKRRKTSYESD